jgi:hypothetical protein
MKVSSSLIKYEFISFILVNKTFASRLQGLNGYEIVLILDDSGSMNLELSE